MRSCCTGVVYEDFDMSDMSDIDYTDVLSDSDINAEIEHVWWWINRHVIIYVDQDNNYDLCTSTSFRYAKDPEFSGYGENTNGPYAMKDDPYIQIEWRLTSPGKYVFVINIGRYGNDVFPAESLPPITYVAAEFDSGGNSTEADVLAAGIKFGVVDAEFNIGALYPDRVFGDIGDPVPSWFPDKIRGVFSTSDANPPLRSDGALLDIIPPAGVIGIQDHSFDFNEYYDGYHQDFYADIYDKDEGKVKNNTEILEQMYYDLLSYLNHIRDLVRSGKLGSDGALKMIEYADINKGPGACPVPCLALLRKDVKIPGEYIDDVIKDLSGLIERKSAEGWCQPKYDADKVNEDFNMEDMSDMDYTDTMDDIESADTRSSIYR